MTVALDGTLNFGPTAGDPLTNTYVPTGTVKGLLMLGTQNSTVRAQGLATDYVTGVDFEGIAMDPVAFDPGALSPFPHDAPAGGANGVGNMWGFFTGSGIPAGNLDFTVDLNLTGSQSFTAVLFAFTATDDTAIEDAQGSSATAVTDPSIDLTLAVDAWAGGMLKSGVDAVGSVTHGADYTTMRESDNGDNVVSWIACIGGESPAGTVPVDWVASSDDAGIIAVAVREDAGGGGGEVELGLHGALELNGLILPVRRQDGAQYREYGVLRPYQNRHRPHVIGRKRVPDE